MVSMSDELKERNLLKLILIVRFACATLEVGHPINGATFPKFQFMKVTESSLRHGRRRRVRLIIRQVRAQRRGPASLVGRPSCPFHASRTDVPGLTPLSFSESLS
jgi:hypothetical protein